MLTEYGIAVTYKNVPLVPYIKLEGIPHHHRILQLIFRFDLKCNSKSILALLVGIPVMVLCESVC